MSVSEFRMVSGEGRAAAPGVPVTGTSNGLKPVSPGVEGNCSWAKKVAPAHELCYSTS